MIDSFDDFCLWLYVMVDDRWQQIAPLFRRPGPQAECSGRALLTMVLVGECGEWDKETTLRSHWSEHRDLFPHLPAQSGFNRRRRAVMNAFNVIRQSGAAPT